VFDARILTQISDVGSILVARSITQRCLNVSIDRTRLPSYFVTGHRTGSWSRTRLKKLQKLVEICCF
jgi:hypothetical protein